MLRSDPSPTTHYGVPIPKHLWILAICLVLFCSPRSFGELGGDVSSVQADQARLSASLRVTREPGYSVHELRSAQGVVVKEFASNSGKIFAISWHGPWPPDLQHLLGSYFEEFQQGIQNRRTAHVVVRHPGLVVEMGGHMRDFIGRAFLPEEMPRGVREEEIH